MSEKQEVTSETADLDGGEASERYQEALERFILFWGEMASNWGINRTMAQIHALLYVAEEPLDTDTIMERLQISRGNANMNLRSLTTWDLIRKVHLPGSRKDFYTAEKDVWTITAQIIKERHRRELQPVTEQLEECRSILWEGTDAEGCDDLPPREAQFCQRIENLIQLMEVFEGFSRALLPFVQSRNTDVIRHFMHLAESMQATATPDED